MRFKVALIRWVFPDERVEDISATRDVWKSPLTMCILKSSAVAKHMRLFCMNVMMSSLGDILLVDAAIAEAVLLTDPGSKGGGGHLMDLGRMSHGSTYKDRRDKRGERKEK